MLQRAFTESATSNLRQEEQEAVTVGTETEPSKDYGLTSSTLHSSPRHAKAELVPARYHNIVVRNTPTSSLKALLLPSDLCSRMLVILSPETGIAGGKLGDSTKADRDSVTQLIETS